MSSPPLCVRHLTGGDPMDAQEPPGSERSMRTSSHRTLGSIRHGGRLGTGRSGCSGIKSSVRQRSVRSSPPRRRRSRFYSASAQLAMQSAVLAIVNPSVCPSVCPSVRLTVCHTLALSQNDSSYDHGVFTGG